MLAVKEAKTKIGNKMRYGRNLIHTGPFHESFVMYYQADTGDNYFYGRSTDSRDDYRLTLPTNPEPLSQIVQSRCFSGGH